MNSFLTGMDGFCSGIEEIVTGMGSFLTGINFSPIPTPQKSKDVQKMVTAPHAKPNVDGKFARVLHHSVHSFPS